MCLLGAEILATTGKDPGEHYQQLIDRFGEPFYSRIDVAASFKQKHVLKNLDAASIQSDSLAGESIQQVLTHAKANQAAIGGVKVSTENGWFAARPSGTENVYKIYAESFVDQTHLQNLINEAEGVVSQAFQQANV
jgi:phosphoglucomutase